MNIGEEEVLFYHEIGLTLSQWAYAENQLLQVLCICLSKDSERKMLATSFLSIENFRSKLAFCDSMISVKFSDSPHLAYWNQLSKKLQVASAKRNKIAHHMSVMYVEGDIGRRFALIPWIDGDRSPATPQPSAPANGGKLKPPTDSLCLREIAGIRLEFYELTKALANLCQLLAIHVEPFPESPAPINDLPSIQSLREPDARSTWSPACTISEETIKGGFDMKATQTKQPSDQPSEDDVLRRMLTTPPKQHEAKPAPAAKVSTKEKPSKSRAS